MSKTEDEISHMPVWEQKFLQDYFGGFPRPIVDRSPERLEELLASIYLYINWRFVTKQLTSEQKELFAKSIESATRRTGEECTVDRWWLE